MVSRSLNSNPDLLPLDFYDLDFDIITDRNALTRLPCQYKHLSLSVIGVGRSKHLMAFVCDPMLAGRLESNSANNVGLSQKICQ